jgi:hypothetical protein
MMEIITTDDKAQRDRLFKAFRASEDPLERQVVKFSGVREVPPTKAGEVLTYRSTWSVAYPTA